MTERERVLAILNHKQPDQLPWLADFAYLVYSMEVDKTLPAKYQNQYLDEGLQRMHRDYGTGFYLQGFEPFQAVQKNVDTTVEQKGNLRITTITSPVGTLHQVEQFSKTSYSYGITEHMIKDIEDLKIYSYICEHTAYLPNYEFAKKRYETIGDNGVVLCYTPKSPLMDLVALRSGVENVTYMAIDDEDEFTALLDEIEEKFDKACQLAVDSPAECIMIPENISSECVASFYQKYMKRYHQKWTKRIREAGKYSFVHQDGAVRGLITQLSKESGFDVIEAVTPLPMGDVAIEEVGSLVDDKTIIWGGIPGGMFVESTMSDEDFDRHVIKCIEVMTQSPRYVLGVADEVVPGSSERRIRRVRELVNRYGTYK